MFMVMLILNDPDKSQSILSGWEEAGAPGITILTSTGIGHVRAKQGLKDDFPLLPSLENFFKQDENLHRTLIAIVRERAVVDRIIQATQDILGDLNRPNTGILAVLPVLDVYGLDRVKK